MSATPDSPKGFIYVEDFEFFFDKQIFEAKSELERYVAEILASKPDQKRRLSENRLQRVEFIEFSELLDCEDSLNAAGKERLDFLHRRKERMRILHLDIADLTEMKEREICRFKDREGLNRKVFKSYEDITNFYISRLTELRNQIYILKGMDNNERRLERASRKLENLMVEEKNLTAEMKREQALGKAKGWVYVFSGVGIGEGATGAGGRRWKVPTI